MPRRAVIFSLLGGLGGCGGARLPDFQSPEPTQVRSAGRDGIRASAYLMRDPGQQKTYFGTVLSDSGIVPCWVSISNDTRDRVIFFRDEDVTASLDARGSIGGNISPETKNRGVGVAGTGGAMLITGGLLLIPAVQIVAMPLYILGSAALADSQEIKRNIMAKQVYSRTLQPTETLNGFLYLSVPKDGAVDGAHLIVRIRHRDLGTSGVEQEVIHDITL